MKFKITIWRNGPSSKVINTTESKINKLITYFLEREKPVCFQIYSIDKFGWSTLYCENKTEDEFYLKKKK